METSALLDLVQLIIDGDLNLALRRLRSLPDLATMALPISKKQAPKADTFFVEIRHYMYGGDTALHMAAAAFSRPMAELLVSNGADCRAKNRRGAEPLHYASDGKESNSKHQADVIKYLVSVGADPNAFDKSGVAPLHRAVRTRSLSAVLALLDAGADLRLRNKSGSTPLHLAVQTTGASGSGSDNARQQQELIVKLLLERGARLTDQDSNGKTVKQSATSVWIQSVLATATKSPDA